MMVTPGTNQSHGDEPGLNTRFLWWLATAEPKLIKYKTAEANRFIIIGTTVFCTWAFATLAWSYFFSTVVEQWWVAILLGLFMGFVILSIDRALIKTISNTSAKKWWPLLFRLVLAAAIGLFMAQPALHFLFKKEIALQINADNIQKRQAQQTAVSGIYQQKINEVQLRKKALEQVASARYDELQAARNNYLAETDGSGGTGKVGVKAVALAKLKEYQKLDSAYRQLLAAQGPEMANLNNVLLVAENEKAKLVEQYSQFFNNGFLTQAEALQHLLQQHPALLYRYVLLVLLLLLIELMPLIAKMMMPTGAYEQNVQLEQELALQQIQQQFKQETHILQLQDEHQLALNEKLLSSFFEIYQQQSLAEMSRMVKDKPTNSNQKGKELLELVKSSILIK